METKMIKWFLIGLFLAFVITRISALAFHDFKNYNSDESKNLEKIKTPTALLRKILKVDIHHIHIGVGLLVILGVLFFLGYINPLSLFILGISLSWIFDQILPLMNLGNYFSIEMTIISCLFHLIIVEICLISFL